jgi:SAM-dependent methyltransferase
MEAASCRPPKSQEPCRGPFDIVSSVSDVRRSYDVVAERYAAEVGSELAGKPLDRALLKIVADAAGPYPVVDIGCGPGHVTAFLATLGVFALGFDVSAGMCAVAHRDGGLPSVVADMCQLPLAPSSLGAAVCLYGVIHLDREARARAYAEVLRVLRPEALALVAFHVFDESVPRGGSVTRTEWWDHPVHLTFRYLDPDEELTALIDTGFQFGARIDRAPYPGVEHPSHRCYLLVNRPPSGGDAIGTRYTYS